MIGADVVGRQRSGKDREEGAGQIGGGSGRAALVDDDFHLGARAGELEHGLGEVLAVGTVEPGGAEDEVLATNATNGLFSAEFRGAVHAGGRALLVFAAGGVVGFGTEHVVGGDVHQPRIGRVGGECEIFYGKVVDEIATLGIIFGGVDVGVGGAVDDAVDGVVVHEAKNGFAVGDVEGQRERIGLCGDIGEVKGVRRGGGEATNFAAELTARAGDENLHGGWDSIEPVVDVEVGGGFVKEGMVQIFFAEQGVGNGHAPVDVEAFVEQGDTGIRFGGVEIVALVFEHGDVAEHSETVGESARNEELTMVFGGEFDGHMLSESGTTVADVYGDIDHAALGAAHEFALRVGHALIVETAHDTACGARFVVLDKADGANFFVKFALGE